MAKKAAAVANISVNSVALESYADNISLKLKQEAISVEGLVQTGPSRVVGNYDYSFDLAGQFDGASGAVDATLAGLIGSSGVAVDFDPTGTSVGANAPHYNPSSVVLESYEVTAKKGAAVMYSCTLQGNSAINRATS